MSLFSINCRQKVEVHFHPTPVQLPAKKGRFASPEGESSGKISLEKFVKERVPSLSKNFKAPWSLFNGHFQTFFCVLGDFTKADQVKYNRTLLRTFTGGTIGLDFTLDFNEAKEDTPIVVVLHGLTGGSYEQYVRGALYPACSPIEKGGLGYRGVVMNYRGCAGTPLTSRQFYSAGFTDDIKTSLMYIQRTYPKAPLLGLGFSLGANVLVKYLAEEQEKSKLIAGCALGCPWDLQRNCDALDTTLVGKYIYSKGMASNLTQRVKTNAHAILPGPDEDLANLPPSCYAHPSYKSNPSFDATVVEVTRAVLAMKSPTLAQFDNTFTCNTGGTPPIMPLGTAQKYYEWAASDTVLKNVRKPLLAMNSADDPVVKHIPDVKEEGNEWVVVAATPGGGHLGWFVQSGEGGGLIQGGSQIERWTTEPVLQWLKGVVDDLDLDTVPSTYTESEDGWVQEVGGRDDLAYKVAESDDVVDGTEVRKESGVLQGL